MASELSAELQFSGSDRILNRTLLWEEPALTNRSYGVASVVLPIGTVTLLLSDVEGSVRLGAADRPRRPDASLAGDSRHRRCKPSRGGHHHTSRDSSPARPRPPRGRLPAWPSQPTGRVPSPALARRPAELPARAAHELHRPRG